MKKINPNELLQAKIFLLERKSAEELIVLKEQFQKIYESLKLVNIIKSTFMGVIKSPGVKTSIGNTRLGLASDYITKNILFPTTRNPIKKLAGILFQTVVTNLAVKNAWIIKSSGKKLALAINSGIKNNNHEFSKSEL